MLRFQFQRINFGPTFYANPCLNNTYSEAFLFAAGVTEEQCLSLATSMGFNEKNRGQAADYMMKLYKLFMEKDATLIEINPMAEDVDGNSRE